jgi:hypothetical protein
MKCPGCGAEVESEHVAHYPPKEDDETPVVTPPADAQTETPPAPKASGWDFSTTLFDGED